MWNARCQACGLSDETESLTRARSWTQSDRRSHVDDLWVASSTSPSRDPKFTMLYKCSLSSHMILDKNIWIKYIESYGISRVILVKGFYYKQIVTSDFMLFVIQTGRVIPSVTTMSNGLFVTHGKSPGIMENQEASGDLEVFSRGRISSYGYDN